MGTVKKTPVIQLIGPPGSGKTTLCRLFLDAFKDKSVLAVDASEDGYLTLSYGVPSSVTMGVLLQQIEISPLSHEAMDWALQDLPVAVPTESEAEILQWGVHADGKILSDTQKELLVYGLPRLFDTYDLVIWDGPLGVAESALKNTELKPLIVITPENEAYCQTVNQSNAMVLLSKAQAVDILPPTAASQVQRGNWRFLGKLPPVSPPEKRIKELPQYVQDCFHRLDLPFELRPRFV